MPEKGGPFGPVTAVERSLPSRVLLAPHAAVHRYYFNNIQIISCVVVGGY